MVDAMRHAKSLNKKVLLTSDMYFPCEIIKNILTSNNIVEWDELIISCDVNGSKYSGNLWKYYRELYKEKQILHIGDDDFADIKQAASYGINTFKVHSALDLLKISSISEVSNKAQTFDDKLLLGNTVACLFNNPFVLSKTNKINVDDFFNIGYSFLGPLILKFILFLINLSAKNNITKMLFLSRDSYILEKLYQNYIQKTGHDNLPKGIYFLTSRRALSVSSIENINGIADVFKHAPYVTRINFKQFLWATFGVQAHENDIYQNQLLYDLNAKELELHIISKYGVEIIETAKEERKCYVDYYLTLGIEENEKIGVVNFVSGGVTQHFFEKVFKNPNTNFIYFATLVNFEDVSCENEVHAVYGKKLSSYTDSTNALVRYYLTAESIFSSPDEQFVRFSNEGLPVYENIDPHRDFSGIARCHEGIESFFNDTLKNDTRLISRDFSDKFSDYIFGLAFSPKKCSLSAEIKKKLNIKDSFSPDKSVQTASE